MARDIIINGECMVTVKGMVGTNIATLSQLGLTDRNGIVRISPAPFEDDIDVDAWGDAPIDEQINGMVVNVSMTLVQFDMSILETCWGESMAGMSGIGSLVRAGTRMGGGAARFAAGNHYIGLNLASPVLNQPWRILYARLRSNPFDWPLGTKRSLVQLNWRGIPYTTDPWNGGQGALGAIVMDRTPDT